MDDLELALIEVWRLREAAERIIWCAETLPRYGKGRGQAAQEILDSVTKMKTPILSDEDKTALLSDIQARAIQRTEETS